MRVVPCVILLLVSLVLAGCGTFAKQPSGKTAPAANPGGDPRMPWPPPGGRQPATPGAPAPAWPTATPAAASGLLAGQILDGFNRAPPASAYIQVALSQEGEKGAPIEVAADDQGYFTIQGLQPGKGYRLIARTKYGDKLLAGSAFATPPNPRVIIRIGEENANANTPPPPPPPAMPERGKGKQPAMNWPGSVGQEGDWSPLGPNNPPRPAGLGAPIPVDGDQPPTSTLQPPVPVPPTYRPEDIARGLARNEAPAVNIPGPSRGWQPAEAPLTPLPPIGAPVATGPAAVPSCVLVGRQLHNLALPDLDGRPWEFRERRARLTLIDFWGTWCTHCLHTIPHLNVMQDRYGPYGLQVVGIAYEDGPPQIQADKVRRVADRLRINYQILLGSDRITCPVRIQFGVASWPTLYLLDESGQIIWKSVGLQPQALTELDAVIRQQLGMR